ncbi:hypothetical protein KIW84_030139 [Lathyrus oleraceus]|uniref:Uncharacterized protein n=1 Tax=Pisum sativum TaxID=3888 RepID=A0A9D5AVU1_PEA|nr:hypothetical protein KIW84_030139 [Pisum sativum]
MDSLLPLRSSSSSSSTLSSSSQPNHTLVSFPFMLASKRVANENMQEFFYLQNGGGLAVALTENAISFLPTLASNPTFLSAICALFVTQSSKVFLNFLKERQWNFRVLFASQGMPSTRSALCSALTTSVALTHGVAGSLFPVSLGFSLIVMCDAVAVKRHVGYQALVVNTLLDALFKGPPVADEKLEEDVGDTASQVLAGALLGSAVAILCSIGFMLLR